MTKNDGGIVTIEVILTEADQRRALQNLVDPADHVMAPGRAQIGLHPEPAGERACFGNSMVIDPWGAVIARASAQPGVTFAELDFDYLDRVRSILPSNTHHMMA